MSAEKKGGFFAFFNNPLVFIFLIVCLIGIVLHNHNETVQLKKKFEDLQSSCSSAKRPQRPKPDRRPSDAEILKANGVEGLLATAISDVVDQKLEDTLDCAPDDHECTLKPGPKGDKGEQGPRGERGERGEKGDRGDIGPQDIPGPSGGGVTYTRWGRTTCPTTSGTTLVYEGLAAGSHYEHHGGGANVICLVKDPKYNPGTTTVNHNNAILYGSEYEIGTGQALNSGLRHNHNVPCAVCHVSTRSSQIMVPGTYQCPSGWTPEYSGWLMGGHHVHKGRNMFTCIDKDAEVVPGQQANNNGNLFYHFEVDCGVGIPCPPYDSTKELSCVVCTK